MKKQRLPEQMNNTTRNVRRREGNVVDKGSKENRGTRQDESVISHRPIGDRTTFVATAGMDMKGNPLIININIQNAEDGSGSERDYQRVPQK